MHRIFVVEDHPTIRATLCELIEIASDLTICGSAGTAAAALAEAPSCAPDLVLVDLALPDLNGNVLTQRLQEQLPHVPVVILSGHPAASYRPMAQRYGAVDYVDKLDAHLTLVPTIRDVLAAAERGEPTGPRR